MPPAGPAPTPTATFREVQYLRQWWLWAIMLAAGALTGVSLAGDDFKLATVLVVGGIWAGASALLALAKLTVEVRDTGIHLRQLCVFRRTIPFEWIEGFEARSYRPLREYLGWGVRYGPSGRAYSMSGNRGLQLVVDNGDRIMIGSQRADEFEQAVTLHMRRTKDSPGGSTGAVGD